MNPQVHRMFWDPREVQQCTLLSIKTGGCTEDCKYCSQSVRYKTHVKPTPQMKVAEVVEAAQRAKVRMQACLYACIHDEWHATEGTHLHIHTPSIRPPTHPSSSRRRRGRRASAWARRGGSWATRRTPSATSSTWSSRSVRASVPGSLGPRVNAVPVPACLASRECRRYVDTHIIIISSPPLITTTHTTRHTMKPGERAGPGGVRDPGDAQPGAGEAAQGGGAHGLQPQPRHLPRVLPQGES